MNALALLLALLAAAPAPAAPARVLADLRADPAWRATASEAVEARLARDPDGSLCLEYDFHGVSGYAVMRRELPVEWPRAFALTVRMKGRGAVNDLQLKLVDGSGDNVWWVRRPDHPLPRTLTDVVWKSDHFSFAWGPTADRTLSRTAAVELVVSAGREGGRGALCASRLTLEAREPAPAVWPEPIVTRGARSLEVDWGRVRDLEGLAVTWPPEVRRVSYDVLATVDGRTWRTLRRVRGSPGGLHALHLPETEARRVRLRLIEGPPSAAVALRDRKAWPDFNAVLSEQARHLPRGHVPRAFLGEQNYWALVGVDGGGERSALLSEDGALELGRGGYSLEPAVAVDGGAPVTWAGVSIDHALRDGDLPMPEVRWTHGRFRLDVAAAAEGPAQAPRALARYALTNTSGEARTFTLLLAVRPWQVNPPQQFLTTPGGARRIERLGWAAGRLTVDGPAGSRSPAPSFTVAPARVTALPLSGGLDLDALAAAPALRTLTDPLGHASALLAWELRLGPGETRVVGLEASLGASPGPAAPGTLDERLDRIAAGWRARLDRVTLELPPASRPVADTLRSTLAQMLVSRDGAMLKPGTRSYARTWIRDGAMMVAGLVRMGELDAARDFVDAFSAFVYPSGKVPCCVDARGADPVVENDSHGQYLYAVAEVWRHSRDGAFLARHWPVVRRVVGWLEPLRQSTRTEAFRASHPANLHGLLPPSISHEGYSDKPAYSYWDDLWAVRGYKDAVAIAAALGRSEEAARWALWRDELEAELAASMTATAAGAGLDHIAGAADRADFDATSTTVALNPAQARVPRALLERTFERYFTWAEARASGAQPYKDYTPYELRTVGALVRLGQPARAHAMLHFFMKDRRPAAWNQWAEVVLPDPRQARFLGDMPHAWVASDYVRSVLDLLAYEREADGALVIGAGLAPAWLAAGVRVKGLSTPWGPVGYRLSPTPGGQLLELEPGLAAPPGGVRLAWPLPGPLPRALHAGRELAWQGRELPLPAPPPAGGPAAIQLLSAP